MKSAVIALLMLVFATLSFAASRRGYTMDVPAGNARSITFDVQEGDLIIRGDPAATSVHMRVSIDRYWLFRLGEDGILKKLIKVSGEGTPELKIVTDIEPSWRNYGRAEYPIDFEVVVPAGAVLNLRDTSGKIEVSDINSAVDVHDGSGTLDVRHVKGPLSIDKESGDVRVQDVLGTTTLASRSGQLHFLRVGELNVTASDGNLDAIDAGSARLVNKGGNIRVSGVKGSVHIDDDSGEIEVGQVGGDVDIRDTSGQIRASHVGALTVDDTSGDLVVDGARSVNVRTKESGQVKLKNVAGEVNIPPGITLARR
ncbi:MAG TPA: DUF4097 family beta strand repeat-containing protein [Terriglobales bacterium]